MTSIVFASGKGGAGKTTLSMSFHKYVCSRSVFADCDVDAADAFLLLEKRIVSKRKFFAGYEYSIDAERCTDCGACRDICAFNAVKKEAVMYIDRFACEGCGACEDVCPSEAVLREDRYCGNIYISESNFGTTMIYARLIPGEDNSGKLVHEVRQKAKGLGENKDFLVIDAPPGIGCPLTASITGVDRIAVVIECSRSGFNDAKRLMAVADQMRIPVTAILNKTGLNPHIDAAVREYLETGSIPLAGELPFDEAITDALNQNALLIDIPVFSGLLKNIFSGLAGKEEEDENCSTVKG